MIDTDYLNSLGGTALGLKIANEISSKISAIKLPAYDIIPIKVFLSKKYNSFGIKNTLGKSVLFKFSGLHEDFSSDAARGINSSRNNPVFEVSLRNFQDLVFNNPILMKSAENFKSIILQELISTGYFYISQMLGDSISIEINYGDFKILIISENQYKTPNIESNGGFTVINKFRKEFNIEKALIQHRHIANITGFSINTEGFFGFNNLNTIVQLRPTPNDITIKFDSSKDIDFANSDYQTHFTFGVFDLECVVLDINDAEIFNLKENLILVVTNFQIPWESEKIKQLVLDKNILFLYRTNCFKLSHSPKDIPPFGILRDKFNYLYIGEFESNNILGKTYKAYGNGDKGFLKKIT